MVPHRFPKGEYLLLFDPLDGSSNIDVNVSIGTIFSVLRKQNDDPQAVDPVSAADFLQAGNQQVAAGYCVYGPQTTLVLTVGDGVAMFTLDREQGSFVLTAEGLKIPEDTKEFAINMSNLRHWDAPVKRYIDECLQGKEGPRGECTERKSANRFHGLTSLSNIVFRIFHAWPTTADDLSKRIFARSPLPAMSSYSVHRSPGCVCTLLHIANARRV